MVGSHLQHDFQVMFVLLQCGNALPQRLHLGQQGLAGGSSGWPCARHHSISRCKRGNRRWKFSKDFSCQGTAWLPLITTWVAAYCRACRTNFASVLIPALLRNRSVRRSSVSVVGWASAAAVSICKIGTYSSVPRSRKEPWQITVAVAVS